MRHVAGLASTSTDSTAQAFAAADPLRVLFIARAYPPTVGGMENFAFRLNQHLSEHANVTALINRRGKRGLPLFLPCATAAAIFAVRRKRVHVVHLADALLAPVGAAIKIATGIPVSASICGLDVTYDNQAYQAVVPSALRRLDMLMPISGATMIAMRERVGSEPRAQTIPLGVNPIPTPRPGATGEFQRLTGIAGDAPVLLTVGRLVERKGVAWFVENVLPQLPAAVRYLVVGEGSQRDAILLAAEAGGVGDRVHTVGRLSDDLLAAAYARADVFVMPNVRVAGDMEGFGLVALEAAASGLPVVASRLEGITEALHHGHNGTLVPPGDAPSYTAAISSLLMVPDSERRALGARAAAYTGENYGWDRTARKYVETIRSVLN